MAEVWRGRRAQSYLLGFTLAVAFSSMQAVPIRDALSGFIDFGSYSEIVAGGIVFVVGTAASFLVLAIAFEIAFVAADFISIGFEIIARTERVAAAIPATLVRSTAAQQRGRSDIRAAEWIVKNFIRPALPGLSSFLEKSRLPRAGAPSLVESKLDLMTMRFTATYPAPVARQDKINYVDPIHGSIGFDSQYSWVLGHPVLQRLNEVRQLAFAFPRFPGGTHTRFSHSLGVAHLAGTAMTMVLDADQLYTADGIEPIQESPAERRRLVTLATVCGLVHDVGHPPFGHTLDRFLKARYYVGEATSDADKSFLPKVLARLEDCLASLGTSSAEVFRILEGSNVSGWEAFIAQLLNSRLDVDRTDYLQRDAHFTGQREGLLNIHALISAIRPFRKGATIFLTFDESYISDLEQFVYARDAMYLRCYEHPQKVVSEAILSRCAKKFFDLNQAAVPIELFALLTDAQLIEILWDGLQDDSRMSQQLRDLFRAEAGAFHEVYSVPFTVSAVSERLETLLGDFNRPTVALPEKISELERIIADRAGIPEADVVLVLPDPKANEERAAPDIEVLMRTDTRFVVKPLFSERDDEGVSDVLRRRKYVDADLVLAATQENLDTLKNAAKRGISLLGILQSARFRLRLFLHSRSASQIDKVRAAFVSFGLRTERVAD